MIALKQILDNVERHGERVQRCTKCPFTLSPSSFLSDLPSSFLWLNLLYLLIFFTPIFCSVSVTSTCAWPSPHRQFSLPCHCHCRASNLHLNTVPIHLLTMTPRLSWFSLRTTQCVAKKRKKGQKKMTQRNKQCPYLFGNTESVECTHSFALIKCVNSDLKSGTI